MSELRSFADCARGGVATILAVLLATGCQLGTKADAPDPAPPPSTADYSTGDVRAYAVDVDTAPVASPQLLGGADDTAGDGGDDQFIGLSLSGQPLYRSQFHGSVLLVTYWSRDCTACRMRMNRLRRLYREYRLRGLEIVAVNSRDSRRSVMAYLAGMDREYPYTIAVAPGSLPRRLSAMRIYDLEGRLAADYPDAASVVDDGLRRDLDRILPLVKSGR